MRLEFAVLLLATAAGAGEFNPIRLPSVGKLTGDEWIWSYRSWQIAVEAHNKVNWTVVPSQFQNNTRDYMLKDIGNGTQYASDCFQVVREALDYASWLPPPSRNDSWLFDLTDTLISNVNYYNLSGVDFGVWPFNRARYNQWLLTGDMPAVPAIKDLYDAAKQLGYKIVILSGNRKSLRTLFVLHLLKAGFYDWDELIFKPESWNDTTGHFKAWQREELLKDGYKVVANVGDQWSDLLGGNNAGRTFKIPNQMYYVG